MKILLFFNDTCVKSRGVLKKSLFQLDKRTHESSRGSARTNEFPEAMHVYFDICFYKHFCFG